MNQLKETRYLIDEVARLENDPDKLNSMPWNSKQMFGQLLEAVPQMIFTTDPKGNILYTNRAWKKCIRYSYDDAESVNIFDLVHPKNLKAAKQRFTQVFKGNSLRDFEFKCRTKYGSYIDVQISLSPMLDSAGNMVAAFGIGRDITEYKQVMEKLRDSEEMYRNIIENSPDIICMADRRGIVLSVSKALKAIFGFDPGEVIGKNPKDVKEVKDVIPEEGMSQVIEVLDQIIGGNMVVGQTIVTRKDDVERQLEFILVPITTNGMVVKIQFMIRDIIDQKRSRERLFTYQQDLRSLTCQLAQTEERERRRLAVDLHDLIGQPLAVIKMKLNAWKNASYSSDHAPVMREVLELLESAIHNTRSLTYDLSPPVLYDLGLEAGLESLLEKFQERYAIRYEYEDDGKEKPVKDEVGILLYRCVGELLINVVKHAKAQLVKVSISRQDGQVLITIEDDGIGFAISETEGGARGFGLFSIREGLNWIGGSFAIQSEPGCGTHATLKAPLKQTENST